MLPKSFAASCCKFARDRWRSIMMPQDSLSIALTTGLGFSVLAGLFSGVVYIISVGYNKSKRRSPIAKPDTPWHCAYCGAQFLSIDGVLEHEKVVTCIKCARKFCREQCATRSDDIVIADYRQPEEQQQREAAAVTAAAAIVAPVRWVCKKCQPDSWINGIVRLLELNVERKEWYTKKMTAEESQFNAEISALQRKEREQVRDFIERLVETLLGGELDNVSVKRIYNDDRYEAIYARYHGDLSSALTDLGSALHITISNLPISGESPCSAHASFKNLVQRFIREAAELPKLNNTDDGNDRKKTENERPTSSTEETNDRTYEDLLSTAIINKVVQNYQNNAPSISASNPERVEKDLFLGKRNLDHFAEDTSSISSVDDYIGTNGSTKYLEQMNLAIQQSIEEVSSSDDEEGVDEVDTTDLRNNEWQENWYLRKRNFVAGAQSPVPVPMLVPNPADADGAKVLIGDRDADDTTDLSDAISDYEDETAAEPSSLNAVLVSSKSLIGGRNPLESLVAKAESISDDSLDADMVQTVVQVHHAQDEEENNTDVLEVHSVESQSDFAETCNEVYLRRAHDEDNSLMSLESNTEKDLEYTEKYATLPRKIPLVREATTWQDTDDEYKTTPLLIEDLKADNGDSGVTSDEDDKHKHFKGSTYGAREKEKWNHAVELPNNPYSKSNLERRLSNRSSSISSLNSANACELSDSFNAAESSCDKVEVEIAPELPKTPKPDMSKSMFDLFNEERKKTGHRFGRDYFAKAAGKPQGARSTDLQDGDRELGDDDDNNDEVRKPPMDEPIIPEETIFRAVPARINSVEEDTLDGAPEAASSIEETPPKRGTQLWDLSSDSDYSIERTYNVNSGRIVKKVGDQEYEVPSIAEDTLVAEGIKYTPKRFDENQNAIRRPSDNSRRQRSQFLRSLTRDEDDGDEKEEESDDFPLISDNELSPVTAPGVNHFKLVDEIANESSELYKVEPISPPADYKTESTYDTTIIDEEESLAKTIAAPIEYESFEKSCEFSLEETSDELIEEVSLSKVQSSNEAPEDAIDYPEETRNDFIPEVRISQYEPFPQEEYETTVEPEIEMLKEQQIVKNRLGTFSKSFPNLNAAPRTNTDAVILRAVTDDEIGNYSSDIFVDEIEIQEASHDPVPSVRNLKKLFESESDIKKEVHSLTARSLPKHVRQELAAQSTSPRTISRTTSETSVSSTAETMDVEETAAPVAFPRAKSRIAFFEQMRQKE